MTEFRGIFPAIITPMGPDGELNESAFREIMELNIRAGVHGFWTAGGTGEGILLSPEENRRIAEISADQNRGRVKNVMHVGAATTAEAARKAEWAARAGVEAICSVPPFFYRVSSDAIVEHYRIIGAATDLPLFVYNLPASTGVEITPELMGKIQDRVPQLVGMKHSMGDLTHIPTFAKMGLSCLTGFGSMLIAAMTMGASGCADGPPGVAPEWWVEAWNAYNDGDLARAEAVQEKASELYPIILENGYLPAMKALMGERLGIDCGSPRRPIDQVTPQLRANIREAAARFGLSGGKAVRETLNVKT